MISNAQQLINSLAVIERVVIPPFLAKFNKIPWCDATNTCACTHLVFLVFPFA